MKERIAIKTSLIAVFSKLFTLVFSLIISRLFVRHIGIELRGVNSVLSDILGFLQLAELGIGAAITYALYEPLQKGENDEVASLMWLYKRLYQIIFVAIIFLGVLFTPLVGFFIHDSTFSNSYIFVVYFIQLVSTAVTYLFAYKRNLFYADQRQYVTIIVDTCMNLCGAVAQIAMITIYKSYILFLVCNIAQVVLSNTIISIKYNRDYSHIIACGKKKYSKKEQLFQNVKNIVIGRIGGWVYGATDNAVLSRFVGVVVVGKMANYYTLKTTITAIIGAIVSPIQPLIAKYIREEHSKKDAYRLFLNYTYVRFCIANVVCVGMITMYNDVISLWMGEKYVLPIAIPILLTMDTFIAVVHGPTGEFINALGLFSDDRNMSIGAMAINLVSSIVLVYYLGTSGVLIGTVLAQLFYWVMRARIVFARFFKQGVVLYIWKILKYIGLTAFDVIILRWLFAQFHNEITVWSLLLEAVICIMVSIITNVLANFITDEFRFAFGLVKRSLFHVLNKK